MASCQRGCAPIVRLCQKVNRLKTLEDDMMATSLKRCLNTLDLTLMGVGGMVGSGLYVLTGTVAKNMVGPAVILSFAIAGFASLLSALCYAEFGARIPKTGSAYMFTYVSVGEVWAFLIGWNVVLENMIGGAATARAWSGYLDSVFNHAIQNYTESHIIMCVIVFVLVFGFMLAEPANWSPKEGGFAPFGLSGILAGSASCFYAFVGFDVIASSSEEAKNPQKAIPIATAVSLALAATAYILVSTVLTLIVPWYSLDPDSALSDAFFRRGYSWAGLIVVIGSLCAMSTVLLCNLYSLPRIIYAMAEDGLFFSFFARVNPVTKVPVNAILVFGFFMSIIALIFDLQALVQFLSIGTLLAYTFVAASVIVLRFQPEKATSQTFKEDSGELKQYESFSDKLQLVERTKVKERRAAGQLKACYEPYLGRFVGDFEPGEVVAFCVLILLVSAASLSAVLTFGNQPLELPLWSFSMLIVIFSLAFVISLALIWAHEPQKDTKTFQVPLVPLIPGASILVNVFLMMKFSAMTWIRFAVWIGIGLVVYFGYGIWHSKEGRRELHTTDMAARYVVLPSGSLVETVQSVQPDGQVEPSGPHVNTGGEFEEKR
uniref:Cationic amino acid transporter C-terminal domain-containing protein n=1 Tax=Periophthalmus magnuspinnatus TaxID=409849 RepID=A0A3B4BGJ3_9GOBI